MVQCGADWSSRSSVHFVTYLRLYSIAIVCLPSCHLKISSCSVSEESVSVPLAIIRVFLVLGLRPSSSLVLSIFPTS